MGDFGSGSFTQSGGNNTISGLNYPAPFNGLLLAYTSSDSGTYNLSGGMLSVPNAAIGYSGTGSFAVGRNPFGFQHLEHRIFICWILIRRQRNV